MPPSTRSTAGRQPRVQQTPANPAPTIQPIIDYRPQEGERESPTPQEAAEPSDIEEEEDMAYFEPAPPVAGPLNSGAAPPRAKPTMTQILAVMTQLLEAQARPASVPKGPAFRTPLMRAPENFDGSNP